MKFQEAFEKYAPQMVYTAWDYTGHSELVDMLWVHFLCYKHSDGCIRRTVSMYKVGDEIVTGPYLGQVLPDRTYNNDIFGEFSTEMSHYGRQWSLEVDEDEFPSRTILRFRPSDQDFSADFYYGHPLASIPEEERGPISWSDEVWLERLRATGNDSAEL